MPALARVIVVSSQPDSFAGWPIDGRDPLHIPTEDPLRDDFSGVAVIGDPNP